MWIRYSGLALLGVALAFGATACKKSSSAQSGNVPKPLANIHWLGTKRIGEDTNAAYLVAISRMPETRRLLNQTLDKLALAPWRAEFKGVDWQTVTNYPPLVAGNAHARILRPLIEDVFAYESYIQTRKAEGKPAEFVIAIRLPAPRAALWKTNLSTLVATKDTFLSGAKLGQTGAWTFVASRQVDEKLIADVKARTGSPATGAWLTSILDLQNLARVLKLDSPALSNLPQTDLTILGKRGSIQARAELAYSKPLQIQLDPWIVPTNLIREPLVGFAAARGIRPLLASTEFWKKNGQGTPPNQVYFWATRGAPWFHYFALPSKDAEAQVKKLGEWITSDLNPVLEANRLGTMVQATGANRFVWKGLPLFAPNLGVAAGPGSPFIYGGFHRPGPNTGPMPKELLHQLQAGTNIVWYDWEFTRYCIEGWMAIGQLSKNTLGYPRLTHTPAFDWLSAVRTNLANCTTSVEMEGPSKLSLARDSAIGLNGAELNLLVDWLESPDFPAGLHSLRAVRPPPRLKQAGHFTEFTVPTNAPAPATNTPRPTPLLKPSTKKK